MGDDLLLEEAASAVADILEDGMPFEYRLVESADGNFRVSGVFQRSDRKNANERTYPRRIWEKITSDKEIRESLDKRAMFGELDHPSDGRTMLSRASHIVTGLELQPDGTVVGEVEILKTPRGLILRELFEANTRVGISSRGSGSVRDGVVCDDYRLKTFDFVERASTPGANPSPSRRGRRFEAAPDDTPAPPAEVDEDDPIFREFMRSLDESPSGEDAVLSLGRSVNELHDRLSRGGEDLPRRSLEEAADAIIALEGEACRLLRESPRHKTVLGDLMQRIEESRGVVYGLAPAVPRETTREEPMDMDQYIRDRLQEAREATEETDTEEFEAVTEELGSLSDAELVEIGLELGVIDEEDLDLDEGEGGEADDDEILVDDEAVAAHIEELEGNLEEACDLIEELSETLEESESETALKYEMGLSILQETVDHLHLLQEAVGGQEKADKLLEALLERLEKEDGGGKDDDKPADDDAGSVVEDVDPDIAKLLGEDGGSADVSDKVAKTAQLSEAVIARLGIN